MDWNPEDVVRVECDYNFVDTYVVIHLANLQSYAIPYTFYQIVQEPLGLPDIICNPPD